MFTNMTKIKVRNGESLEQALRRFNREVQKSGILDEIKLRERFQKPSELRRLQKKERARKIAYDRRRSTQ
jgi:small subunit ribosomal protein S21